MSPACSKKFLLIKNRALGDSVMCLSSALYLKSLYPDCHITLALPAWIVPLYKETQSCVDEFLPLKLNSLKDCFSLYKTLKNQRFDYIYEFHQSGRSGKFFKLFGLLSSTTYQFHNHHLKSHTQVIDQGLTKPLIQRDLDGIYSALIAGENPPSYLDFPPKLSAKEVLQSEFQIIFGIVATREAKCWPIEHFSSLAKMIQDHDPSIKILTPVSASRFDQDLKSKLEQLNPGNISFLETSLEKLPGHLQGAKLYIGNDTGLKHLAVALGVKTFTFFGPEPPIEWHPYDQKLHPYFYRENLDCRTRQFHYCPLSKCDLDKKFMVCLKSIGAQDVFDSLRRIRPAIIADISN